MRRILVWLLLLSSLALAAGAMWRRDGLHPASGRDEAGTAPSASAPGLRGAQPFVPWTPEPSAHAGEAVTVELMEPPAERYAAATATDADAAYAATVAALNRPDVLYDAALGRAARELAYQQSLIGGLIPMDIVDFLMRSSGAVDRTVEQGYTATSGDGAEAARERIQSMLGPPDGAGPVRVGVGEVWIPGARLPRIVAILLSRQRLDVSEAPRRAEPGSEWTLSGVLPRGYESPSALVLGTDGKMSEVAVTTAGARFRVVVPVGGAAGTLHLNVGAVGPRGPVTLAQVPVEIGRALPDSFTTRLPPDEREVATPEAAEALALDLLNGDRLRFGLKALSRDPRLDAVARAHSVDMRDHAFFGHRSPSTGDPGDRLSKARYRAQAYAENLALESSLHAAEAGLLASLGHRRNILNAEVTHVGLGVARRERGGHVEWHVTQLFALPLVVIDGEAEATRVRGAIAQRRRAAGLPELAQDAALDRVCRAHARAAAEGKLDGIADRVRRDAERAGLSMDKVHVWVHRTADVATVDPPLELDDASCSRVGVGVVQAADDPAGMTGVVVIFDGDPG